MMRTAWTSTLKLAPKYHHIITENKRSTLKKVRKWLIMRSPLEPTVRMEKNNGKTIKMPFKWHTKQRKFLSFQSKILIKITSLPPCPQASPPFWSWKCTNCFLNRLWLDNRPKADLWEGAGGTKLELNFTRLATWQFAMCAYNQASYIKRFWCAKINFNFITVSY